MVFEPLHRHLNWGKSEQGVLGVNIDILREGDNSFWRKRETVWERKKKLATTPIQGCT
jgi:hypothetical protein